MTNMVVEIVVQLFLPPVAFLSLGYCPVNDQQLSAFDKNTSVEPLIV